MGRPRQKRILGLTTREIVILAVGGFLVICLGAMFAGYIVYSQKLLGSVSVTPPTSESQTVQTLSTSTIEPTITLLPQPVPTNTLELPATTTSIPAQSQDSGTFNNPVPIGAGYTFPEFGTLTVLNSSWLAGQTGYAIVQLSFTCERPPDQECETLYISLSAVGSSGNGYQRSFDSAIPMPDFGSFMTHTYGGGTDNGNAGFQITNNENSLLMRVELALGLGNGKVVFFKISD